jgi:hypothetical protein
VAQAPEQLSPRDTIKTLGSIDQQVDAIRAAIGGTAAKVAQVHALAAAALHGGEPGPMLGRLDAIRQALLAVLQRCGTAKQHIEIALAEARRVGAPGNLARASVYPHPDHRRPVRPHRSRRSVTACRLASTGKIQRPASSTASESSVAGIGPH